MPTATCNHRGCDAAFTKPSQTRADQALLMHVGRVHEHTIQNGSGRSARALIIHRSHPRSHLTEDEIAELATYIRLHRTEHASKTECLRAALKANGLEGRISVCYGAVKRYFAKASNGEQAVKRKYTKRQKPLVQEIKVNFCPQCGCNIHAVATGMAMAKLS